MPRIHRDWSKRVSGRQLADMLGEIRDIIEASGDVDLKVTFDQLAIELSQPDKDRARILSLWETVKASATLNGASDLVMKVTDLLRIPAG